MACVTTVHTPLAMWLHPTARQVDKYSQSHRYWYSLRFSVVKNRVLMSYRSSETLLQNCPQDWAGISELKDQMHLLYRADIFISMASKEFKQPSLALILSICPPSVFCFH